MTIVGLILMLASCLVFAYVAIVMSIAGLATGRFRTAKHSWISFKKRPLMFLVLWSAWVIQALIFLSGTYSSATELYQRL